MPKITPKENGPLLVQGISTLKRRGEDIELDKPVHALCRCGASQNKPFWDGAHAQAGFTSDKGGAKIRNTPVRYTGDVEGTSVSISYTPVLCGHIAACQALHKQVFDPPQQPWIQPESGTLDGILSVIKACPSGALRVSVDGEPEHHIDSDATSIRITRNGPYVVKNVDLDAEFNGTGASQKEYILCRCGQSKNKPFCDGTHYDVNWSDGSD